MDGDRDLRLRRSFSASNGDPCTSSGPGRSDEGGVETVGAAPLLPESRVYDDDVDSFGSDAVLNRRVSSYPRGVRRLYGAKLSTEWGPERGRDGPATLTSGKYGL